MEAEPQSDPRTANAPSTVPPPVHPTASPTIKIPVPVRQIPAPEKTDKKMMSRKRPLSTTLPKPSNSNDSKGSGKVSLSNADPKEKHRFPFSTDPQAAILLCKEEMPEDLGTVSEDELEKEVKQLAFEVNQLYRKRQLNGDSADKRRKGRLLPTSSNRSNKSSQSSSMPIRKRSGSGGSSSSNDLIRRKRNKRDHSTIISSRLVVPTTTTSPQLLSVLREKKNDEDLVRASQYVSQNWESLQLGKVLGSPAYNEFLRRQLYVGGHGLSSLHREVPQLSAEQLLEVVQSLRPSTVLPPGESVLHWQNQQHNAPELLEDATINGTATKPPGQAKNDDDFVDVEDDEDDDNDLEVQAINDDVPTTPHATATHETHERTRQQHPQLQSLFMEMTQLYETLCWQDADDWSSYRRHANLNLSASSCISELKSLENNVLALKQQEGRILQTGRELGLYDDPQISLDIGSLLGYGRQPQDDPYI